LLHKLAHYATRARRIAMRSLVVVPPQKPVSETSASAVARHSSRTAQSSQSSLLYSPSPRPRTNPAGPRPAHAARWCHSGGCRNSYRGSAARPAPRGPWATKATPRSSTRGYGQAPACGWTRPPARIRCRRR